MTTPGSPPTRLLNMKKGESAELIMNGSRVSMLYGDTVFTGICNGIRDISSMGSLLLLSTSSSLVLLLLLLSLSMPIDKDDDDDGDDDDDEDDDDDDNSVSTLLLPISCIALPEVA